LLLGNSEFQRQILPLCSMQDFEGLAAAKLFSLLVEDFKNNQKSDYEGFHRRLAGEPEQALLAQLQIEEVPESPSRDTAESFLNALRSMRLASYRQKILTKIAEAAKQKDDELLNQLIEQRVSVDRELVSLSRK